MDPVGRGGLIGLPLKAERGLLGSLFYPFWDGLGLACLVLMPPVLGIPALVVFGLIPMVAGGGIMLLFGGIAFAFIVVFAAALGYFLRTLEEIIVSSAQGNTHHPRWPDVEFSSVVGALVRWSSDHRRCSSALA